MSTNLRRRDENFVDVSAWISQSEAARLRGVTRAAISALVKRNRLKTLKIGGKNLLNRGDIENYQPQPRGPKPKKKHKEVESNPPQTRPTSSALRDRNGTSQRQKSNRRSISGYPDIETLDRLTWISQAEAARLRDISPQSISELVKRGRFTTMMVGARKFLKRSEVENFEPQLPGPDPKRKRKM
jgi:excisionase family DNA binding protein